MWLLHAGSCSGLPWRLLPARWRSQDWRARRTARQTTGRHASRGHRRPNVKARLPKIPCTCRVRQGRCSCQRIPRATPAESPILARSMVTRRLPLQARHCRPTSTRLAKSILPTSSNQLHLWRQRHRLKIPGHHPSRTPHRPRRRNLHAKLEYLAQGEQPRAATSQTHRLRRLSRPRLRRATKGRNQTLVQHRPKPSRSPRIHRQARMSQQDPCPCLREPAPCGRRQLLLHRTKVAPPRTRPPPR
jgi:hypothetical protein